MFETGRLAYLAYLRSAEYYDYEMVHNVYYLLTGMTNQDIIKKMSILYGDTCDVAAWRAKMVEEKANILAEQQRVFKKKGLVTLLKYLQEHHIPCALASSSKRDVVERYLEIESLQGMMTYIIAGDEVCHGKPHPEIFINSCKKAGVAPAKALVLEDSIVGIRAANAGRIDCCWIQDDIRDMPMRHKGKALRVDVTTLPIQDIHPTYQRDSLLDVMVLVK